jgi:hypothetical protein
VENGESLMIKEGCRALFSCLRITRINETACAVENGECLLFKDGIRVLFSNNLNNVEQPKQLFLKYCCSGCFLLLLLFDSVWIALSL